MIELGSLLRTIKQHDRGFHLLAGDFNTLAPGDCLRLPQAADPAARAGLAERRPHPLAHDSGHPQRRLRGRVPHAAPGRSRPELSGVGSARASRLRVRAGGARRARAPCEVVRAPPGRPGLGSLSTALRKSPRRPSDAGSIIEVYRIARSGLSASLQVLPAARYSSRRTMSTTASSFPVTQEPLASDASAASSPILDAAFDGIRRVPSRSTSRFVPMRPARRNVPSSRRDSRRWRPSASRSRSSSAARNSAPGDRAGGDAA